MCLTAVLHANLERWSQDCPVGGYCAMTGAASVSQTFTPCPAGSYNGQTGSSNSTSCTPCPVGMYSPVPASSNISACRPCAPGTYNPSTGATECIDCADGFYQSAEGATECAVCPAGWYSANVISCEECTLGDYCPLMSTVGLSCERVLPFGTTTGRRAASEADCVCKPVSDCDPYGNGSIAIRLHARALHLTRD